jgi:hypothetical protein
MVGYFQEIVDSAFLFTIEKPQSREKIAHSGLLRGYLPESIEHPERCSIPDHAPGLLPCSVARHPLQLAPRANPSWILNLCNGIQFVYNAGPYQDWGGQPFTIDGITIIKER